MQIIDCHTHIDFDEFDTDRNEAIKRAEEVGVSDIIVSSTTADRWGAIKQLCEKHSRICHPAYGLHPMFMNDHKLDGNDNSNGTDTDIDNDLERLKLWLTENKAVAVGEIGLDYFVEEADDKNKAAQLDLFISQLEIAKQFNLPVIIHARKSLDIILKYLRRFPSLTGVIHSFSGSEQQAKQFIELGFYLSFGGAMTYDRALKLHRIVKQTALESLLIETDSPDMPVADHNGERNEPAYIVQVIEKMAQIKCISAEEVALVTAKNATKLYRLSTD